jgi:glycolate oxidase
LRHYLRIWFQFFFNSFFYNTASIGEIPDATGLDLPCRWGHYVTMIVTEAKRAFEALLGREFFSTRPEDLILYGTDGTNDPTPRPDAVARPGNVNEVAGVIKVARQYGIPVVPRGAGSSLSGGALPVKGGVVCVMTRMDRILEIDSDNLVAVVEPGCITAKFQEAAEEYGLFYPPDPASRDFSTLGGNAAENAGGTRAVKYGVTRDYILGLEAVIGTGEIITTGVRTAKGVVGYDLTRLLVGSEGTLGIITKLIMRLIPAPEAKETVLAYYDDLYGAARTVAALTAAKVVPATLEFMDQASIGCVTDYRECGLNRDARALLLIETDGPAAQAAAEADVALQLARDHGASEVRRARDKEEADAMWTARRAISPALFRVASGKFNEDIVVPRSRIPDMIKRVEGISAKHDIVIVCFGHAGDGNIHVNAMFDKNDPDSTARAHKAVHDIFTATLELDGTLSGEHGIGTTKRDLIGMELSSESLSLMARIKTAFDPDGIMNPGKVFPQ